MLNKLLIPVKNEEVCFLTSQKNVMDYYNDQCVFAKKEAKIKDFIMISH